MPHPEQNPTTGSLEAPSRWPKPLANPGNHGQLTRSLVTDQVEVEWLRFVLHLLVHGWTVAAIDQIQYDLKRTARLTGAKRKALALLRDSRARGHMDMHYPLVVGDQHWEYKRGAGE